jgi:hypothetical protein
VMAIGAEKGGAHGGGWADRGQQLAAVAAVEPGGADASLLERGALPQRRHQASWLLDATQGGGSERSPARLPQSPPERLRPVSLSRHWRGTRKKRQNLAQMANGLASSDCLKKHDLTFTFNDARSPRR